MNLINLNVDSLFELHSVPEIDIVHKKIQAVVEEKREQVRTMVGERYRDLLKAADTIAAMQTSAGTLIEQVDCVHANCRSLNEQQLIGFKSTENVTDTILHRRNANKQLNNYYSTMVQIKLLTSLPELIWSHIDQEQFYTATELFIFSRHISTGLQLDANNALMQELPVARKQWETLRTFHLTIKQYVLSVLEQEELSVEATVECMLSLLLLDKCNLNQVVQTFLQLRCAAFLNCLSDTQKVEVEHKRRVKERILASLRVLNGTVNLLETCLLQNGLLFERIAEYAQESAPPSITRMDANDRQLAHLLPDIIANFRPKFNVCTLEDCDLGDALDKWLTDTSRIAATQLKQIFALVTNMQTIQLIKNEANAYRRQHNFTQIAERFGLSHTLDFYDLRYVPLINERVRDIISDSWIAAMQQTYDSLKRMLTEIELQTTTQKQIWLEDKSDLPISLAQALSEDLKGKKLLNKTKGYESKIIELCAAFDQELTAIIDELNVLLQEQTTRTEDKLALIDFLRDTAQQQLTHFISQVKSLSHTCERSALLFIVRTCVALVELCPHLKICFCQQSSWRQWIGNVTAASVEHWQRMCALIEEETLQLWLILLDGILAERTPIGQGAMQALTHDIVLEDFVNWQTIVLEQKDEQDNALQSTIRIPNQPRISLQTHLFALVRDLNVIVPETLPPKALQAFNNKLLSQLLDHYESLAKAERTQTSQNVALQLYFDLKFLPGLFGISREERTLYERFISLQTTLRDCIDPFDFELFVEHISTNVKRSVARLNGEFGVLTPTTHAAQTIAASTLLAHESDPNVLCLSSSGSTSLWFPLLPIVTPQTGTERGSKTTHIESEKSSPSNSTTTPTRKSTSSSTRKSDTNKSKSSAASFFGMSQEWFR